MGSASGRNMGLQRRERGQCRHHGCEAVAVWAIFAVGYPAAMYITCDEHIGAMLRKDLSQPGSTAAWTVRPRQSQTSEGHFRGRTDG